MASGHQSTVYEQRLESSPTEGAPVAEGEPEEANGIEDPRKRQRQKHAHPGKQFARARFQFGDSLNSPVLKPYE